MDNRPKFKEVVPPEIIREQDGGGALELRTGQSKRDRFPSPDDPVFAKTPAAAVLVAELSTSCLKSRRLLLTWPPFTATFELNQDQATLATAALKPNSSPDHFLVSTTQDDLNDVEFTLRAEDAGGDAEMLAGTSLVVESSQIDRSGFADG
ncbi:MAG: hypothetical protein OXT71_21670 [Acidobacteriota bacterium]|nr:hypothetical protein [Acidobacteriota bacterium]